MMLRRVRGLLAGLAILLPLGLHAQTLDFDSVCATPPCDPAGLYAGVGVSFAGGGASIVAAGTNGLTGTNGGLFMQVSVFPFQNTITLTRTSTYATLDVARATGTTAGQTFTVQALNNGAPVGTPVTVTLGAVNVWSTLVLSVPGGFNGIFLDTGLGGATKTYGVDNVRIYGTCNGFSDVLPADSFCNATEWLANRGVTQGCVAGQYCPTNNVTRAQMALFMNRLGVALTPSLIEGCCGANSTLDIDTVPGPIAVCTTGDYTAGSFPRHAVVTASFAGEATAALGAFADLAYSVDSGVTWILMDPGNRMRIGATAIAWTTTSQTKGFVLQPQQKVRFGMRFERETGAGDFSRHRCFLQATIHNRNAASPPLDTSPVSLD